jgi:hypothetical protein
MIYPKQKKILKAASGMDAEKIQAVNNAITTGVSFIPGVGTAVSAGLKVGSALGDAISGDGTNALKNIIGDQLNPLSSLNSIMSGNFKEAIPVFGSIMKAKRLQKEKETLESINLAKESAEAQKRSNSMFSKLTFEDGGSIPGNGTGSQDKAVILSGKTHDDGGNPIVDAETGDVVAETEREELLLTKAQTEMIENHITLYNKTGDKEHFIHLGKIVAGIIRNETIDHTKKMI